LNINGKITEAYVFNISSQKNVKLLENTNQKNIPSEETGKLLLPLTILDQSLEMLDVWTILHQLHLCRINKQCVLRKKKERLEPKEKQKFKVVFQDETNQARCRK
jgi:hypothetical protein